MRRLLSAALACTAPVVAAAFVQPPPVTPRPNAPATRVQTVTVHGCIEGRTIVDTHAAGTSAAGDDTSIGSTFHLKGSRALMKLLDEHNGHEDEITGKVRLTGDATARVIGEKRTGKARVYGGKRTGTGGPVSTGQDGGDVEMTGLTHVLDRCG